MATGKSQSSGRSNQKSSSTAKRPTHNKNNLKSDHDAAMSANPAAKKDQFGSSHNKDKQKTQQRKTTKPAGNSDLAFRESAQDVQADRGSANKKPGRRRQNGATQNK